MPSPRMTDTAASRLQASRLVRPELAVFLSYGKMWLSDELVDILPTHLVLVSASATSGGM